MEILKRALLILLLLPSQLSWAESPHAYFDWLSQRPSMIVANGYRTDTEIDRDSSSPNRPNAMVSYDNVKDAAKITFAENVTNLKRVKPSLDNSGWNTNLLPFEITDGNLLFTWDAMFGSGFSVLNNGDDLVWPKPTFKTFHISKEGRIDKRRWEVRTVFNQFDEDPAHVAGVDYRMYEWDPAGLDKPVGKGGCPENPGGNCQLSNFIIDADIWLRYWMYVDYDGGTVSAWVADENTAPVLMLDKMPVNFDASDAGRGVNNFWFQYNSSQQRQGPEIYAWFRNFAVLQNVADVDAIVAQGKKVGGGLSDPSPPNSDTTPPASPTSLLVQ